MLFADPKAAPARWQWHGAARWHDYSPEVSTKLERIYLFSPDKKLRHFRFWDEGMLREVDLVNMVQMPGRRKLRRIGTDVKAQCRMLGRPDLTITFEELKAEKAAAAMKEGEATTRAKPKPKRTAHSLPSRRPANKAPAAVRPAPGTVKPTPDKLARAASTGHLPQQRAPSKGSKATVGTEQSRESDKPVNLNSPAAMRRLLHPAFRIMEEPAFAFVAPPPLQRRVLRYPVVDVLTETVALAEEYAECLKEGRHLPVRTTPDQAYAAVALALYMSGPYQSPSTREGTYAYVSPEPSEAPSQTSRSSIWNTFQTFASSSLVQFGSVASRRPSSAPAGGRAAQERRISELALQEPIASPIAPSSSSSSSLAKLPSKLVFSTGRESHAAKALAHTMREAWHEWQGTAKEAPGFESLEPVPPIAIEKDHPMVAQLRSALGDFTWITLSNDYPRRLDRLHCGLATLWQASKLKSSEDILKQTKFVRHGDPGKQRRPQSAASGRKSRKSGGSSVKPRFLRTDQTALEAAVCTMQTTHERAAAVFICAPFRVGAEYFLGLVPGEEEEAFLRSTFYFSMLEAKRRARLMDLKDHCGDHPDIPDDGAVFCKNVLVLRGPADVGYAAYRDPVEVPAVFAISMPQESMEEGLAAALIRKKVDTILKNLVELEVSTLIISGAGAGHAAKMFGKECGVALGLTARSQRELLPKEVIVAGGAKFYEAVSSMNCTELSGNNSW